MPPTELYSELETQTSRQAIAELGKALPEPIVLAGGNAVWALATEDFESVHGAPYLGSRDADFGFTINATWTVAQLRESTYGKALTTIHDLGYAPYGSTRYCRFIHRETGATITEEESKRVPTHDLHQLFVDPMVDAIHPRHDDVFQIKALDEPLLRKMFDDKGNRLPTRMFGSEIWLPVPALLVAMKLKSFPQRTKDDKAIKDICDAYAVAWHGGQPYKELVSELQTEYPDYAALAGTMAQSAYVKKASVHLGVRLTEVRRVISGLNA